MGLSKNLLMKKRIFPIGMQIFEKLINDNAVYVDGIENK
jgi:hypothetical protein